jgi:hypothetical protein
VPSAQAPYNRWRRLAGEPLVHFLLIDGGVFAG